MKFHADDLCITKLYSDVIRKENYSALTAHLTPLGSVLGVCLTVLCNERFGGAGGLSWRIRSSSPVASERLSNQPDRYSIGFSSSKAMNCSELEHKLGVPSVGAASIEDSSAEVAQCAADRREHQLSLLRPSKKNSRRRRRQERQQRRLEGQQTEAPSEVVVIDSDSDDCVVQPLFPWTAENTTQSCSFTPSDGKQSQELESEKQGGNNLTTVVTVQGKPSDVRVAIRVKDISLLTRKPSETSSKSSSYSIGCDLAEAGTTGDTISTSVTVDDSTDINVAIRMRDISSLTDNPPKEPVERLQSVAGESEILEPDCSFRSRDDLLPRNLSGASVRVNPLENKVEKEGDKKPDAEKAYQVGKDGNSTLINSKKSKKRKKPKKPKKKKNKLKNVPQQDSNLQNFSQHVQHPSVPQTSDFSEVNPRPHFYTESSSTDRPHFYTESSSTDRPHFYSESSSTDRPHFYTESSSTGSPELRNRLTGLNPFTRNKHLDRAVIQDMRVERRKLRKEMRRQRKQELNNWTAQQRVPFHSDRAGPLRSRFQNDFGNCETAQSGGHGWNEHPPATSMRLVHSSDVRRFDPYKNPGMPPPWQRSDGRCNFWPSFGGFGVVSGGISRDNRLQRSSVQASNDSNPPESFTNPPSTSESSRPPENMEVSRDPRGVEESKSNQTPETKPFSDAVKSTNITRPTVIVSPKNNIQHQIAQRLLDLKPNMKSEVKFEVVPNLGVARSQVIPPVPDKSSLQQTFAPSSSVSETPSTNSSASIAAPTTTKLPWSALSDTSWSSLFHKRKH
ncbi:hypothetical protein GE061_006954 [Apolygus lucorum]|uniref:Uncharacterized protein n=1 Tax=Apolygus lucorum TaxID=248454 RepID=A0A8S9WS52_APOLU|nr:hypothetical protein GE061_006954 [Apolygus lucorum]